ncbi:2-dehydropantoate 2-reductase [Roseiarcaceae bacterium H3SJ34-1]|uniref:ketopantoate reductase family protein n=1 Tax=Terripilifer ovatus TaxID=3032367 RepID=UPI003AB9979A|nr:2-dehydropantoate 2-reductase [Roseiarcaceae bacterium H3SJ34-1]
MSAGLKVMIVGAGAIGSWLAAVLARGGADVSIVARGTTLDALQMNGLTLLESERSSNWRLPVSHDAAALPRPDLALFSVKTHAFADAVRTAQPALAHGPAIMTAMNGLPWWFLDGEERPLRGTRLESIDPGGSIAAQLGASAAIGAVVHASTVMERPGAVRSIKIDRLIVGDAAGQTSALTQAFSVCIAAGGVTCPVTPDIRQEIWAKLAGNSNMNPLSALTRLSATPLLDDPKLLDLVRAMMTEFEAVGCRLGFHNQMPAEERIAITRRLGNFRTSMLADANANRPLEIEGLLGCVVEIARRLDEPTPVSRIVYALASGLDVSARLDNR